MKRFICLILSMCMLFLNVPIIASAAEIPSLTIECPETVKPGEEIEVTVTLSDASDYTALEYCFTYDSEKFEIVSIVEGDEFFFYFPIMNPSYSENQAHFSFALNSSCSTNGLVMTAKMRAKSSASGTAEFKVENCKMSDGEMNPVVVSLDSKQTSIKTAQFTISTDVEEAISEDTITAVVSLIDGSALSNFEYNVLYDNSRLEVVSATANSRFASMAQVNPNAAENKVYMNFAAGRNFNYSGELMTIVFKVKNNTAGKAELSFVNQLLVDENTNSLPVAIIGDSVDIECTHKGVEWEETKTPDCKDPGLKEYECACGYYDSEELPKGDHNHQPTVFNPTKEDQGYTLYKCTGCGDEYKDNYVDALGYDVVFDANGGEFDVEKQNKRPDADLTITSKIPTKTGHTFKGWATDDNVTTVEYAAGSKYSANEDVTLYAVWEINTYKITYKVDGEIYKEYNDVEYDSAITAEPNPTKTGHTFSGWSTILSKMPANDVVITGTFAANQHNIIYKVDGKEYKRATLGYGTTITPEPVPTKEGHTFSGWSSIPATMPDEDVVITGTFSVNSYKLVYKVDGEEHSSEDVPYGTALIPKTAPTKEGHTFSGWSTIPTTMPANDVTITGIFSANTYKVFYKVDGADYKSANVVFGTTIPAEANPTKTGYTFSGWSSAPTTMPDEDVTITGTFTVNKHDVIYEVDGTEYDRVELAYGSTITPIAAPTKTGFTFSGWSSAPATMPDEDVTITGTFTVNKHDVIYKVDGTEYDRVELAYGSTITPIAVPTKTGYTFSGWSTAPATMPDNNVTITGTFTINKHDVIYMVDGTEYNRVELAYGSAITPIAAPTKTGHTFSGWSSAPATMPDNDVTITGSFSVNSYKLVYKLDGEQYSSEDVPYGTTLTPKTAPTKEGHTFSGWSTVPATMPANDVTITGTFSINSYKLTYKVDGAEYSSEDVVYGTAIVPKVEPTKEGYTFSGWSLIPATMPANDVVITGKFSLGNYKLVYKIDGEVYKTIAYGFDADVIPEDAPVKEGYTFSGWSTIPSKMPANDVTVTGTFSINSYKLVYKLDGEQYSSEDVVYGTALTPKTAPTKEGHTFSGWSTVPATMPANNVTITGSFSINTYKVFYKVDNAEYKSVDVVYGAAIPMETAPTKEGHTFSGWSEAPATMPAENVTITGSFTVNKYKLLYKVDENEYSSEDVAYGTAIVAKEAPTKEGYTFSGWSAIPATMPAENVTITGTFAINTYNLIYNVDGTEYKKVPYEYNATIVAETAPTKEGYVFVKWENIPSTMPANDVTVNAVWKKTYKVTGKAFFNGLTATDIEVSIENTLVNTNESGEYVIGDLIAGTYTLTAKKGAAEETKTVVVVDSDVIIEDINLKTLVTSEDYTGSNVVGIETLDKEFKDSDKDYVSADDNNVVAISVATEEKSVDSLSNASDIKNAIPSGYKSDLYYFEIDIKKSISGTETAEENIVNSDELHKITVELPDTMKNKQAYTIIRNIDSVVDILTTTANANGEKIEVSEGKVYIYTKSIDGFAISYKQKSSGGYVGGGISRVSTVTDNISSKEVLIGTKVELKTTTKNATIYYTLDGTTPTEKSTEYTAPIVLMDNVVIKAIAVKKGMTNSNVATFEYVVKKAEIKLASPVKYMDAYDDNSFKPDQAITRYEVITALNNVFNIQETDLNISFSDVDEKYSDLVKLFTGASIIDGYEDKTFRGDKGITRAELVKILSIMLKIEKSSEKTNFTDIEGHWAEEYINAFAASKYILGYPDGSFKPDNNISRAEFVVIINRITKLTAEPTENLTDIEKHWAYNEITIATK